jgi:uracil phosphoribosyltransferase
MTSDAPGGPMKDMAQPARDEVLALPQLRLSRHPLVAHKLTLLRRTSTDVPLFRRIASELTYLLGYEATADLPLLPRPIETPVAPMQGYRLGVPIAIVPILRAGLGMIDGFLDLMPEAHVWHIGLYRDERTLRPVSYYNRVLKELGARQIRFIGFLAAPYGVLRLASAHPDVTVFVGALDDALNEAGYIVPGLGDAGDRLFATGGQPAFD